MFAVIIVVDGTTSRFEGSVMPMVQGVVVATKLSSKTNSPMVTVSPGAIFWKLAYTGLTAKKLQTKNSKIKQLKTLREKLFMKIMRQPYPVINIIALYGTFVRKIGYFYLQYKFSANFEKDRGVCGEKNQCFIK